MDLENSVREHSALLTSSRANDRKRNAEILKDLLTRNALAALLTKNTLKKRGFTWNDLFDDINEYIHKETEKFESSKTFDSVTSPLCTSLLHMCVAGANKGQAYIKCDKILDACLFILKDNRLTKAFGDAYLNLLHKNVLCCEHYLGYITPKYWEDLLDVCSSVCLSTNSKLDNYTKLRLVSLIIKNGIRYSQIVISLRDILTKLKKCFMLVHNDTKVHEVVIEIVNVLLKSLSSECRLTMCEFTETSLPIIVKFYDHSLEKKKKIALFQLLELAVSLHHPQGKLPKEEGSLANSWEIWDKHMSSILEIISLEVTYLQKSRKQTENPNSRSNPFYSLAAAVYFQIFSSPQSLNDDTDQGTSCKRQKVGINKYKTFTDLLFQLQLNHLPWLEILHMYIKLYGNTVSYIDYITLIKIMENLLNGSSHSMDWDILAQITCMTVNHITTSTCFCYDALGDTFLSLWNSCVRNSTSMSAAYKPIHTILQLLLTSNNLNYQNVQPLIKLYFEKGMPVNESSVQTLNCLFHIFFNKCSYLDMRIKFFHWFIEGDVTCVDVSHTKKLFLTLVSNDNIDTVKTCNTEDQDDLYNFVFNSVDKSILFSEFQYEIPTSYIALNSTIEITELNIEINILIQDSLQSKLSEYNEQFCKEDLLRFMEFIRSVLSYFDILLRYKYISRSDVTELQLYSSMKASLDIMFSSLIDVLKSNTPTPLKSNLLQYVKELLLQDYDKFLSVELRRSIKEDFFHYTNNIMTAEHDAEEDVICDGDEAEINATTLKYNCIYVLAAYCKIRANYTEEILELILDPKLYNFTCIWDVKCAFQCIEILSSTETEEPPLESIFILMQHLCKDLFRIPEATTNLLNILIKRLELFWENGENMRQNCFIMTRGFLERCDKLFYPPNLAALIYKCAAKIVYLNKGQIADLDDIFTSSLMKKCKGDIHSIRLYSCYLLKTLISRSSLDSENYLCGLSDIFLINVSERKVIILKDESMNRTLTVLHSYLALTQGNKSLIPKIVTSILQLQNEKSLDVQIARKVLNLIICAGDNKAIDMYLNRNILSVLHFWFSKKLTLSALPFLLFGIKSENDFVEKHMKWLLSADILWRCGGNINESVILRQIMTKHKIPQTKVIEICFCNIIVICLPYVVTEKYKLRYAMTENQHTFKQLSTNANRMFEMTRHILESENWSNLFVENVGELLLLSATHLKDCHDAKEQFDVDAMDKTESYYYPKAVFSAILDYFGELTDGNIMQYLCENQPVAIFKILLKLWENVLQEDILELKVLCLHAFKTFVEYIPLDTPSDAFTCNYVCNCFGFAIKKSQIREEIKILIIGLKEVLVRFLPNKVDMLRKSVAQLTSILIIKKEEGYEPECKPVLMYLFVDMKDYLKEEDVVDFLSSMSTQRSEKLDCSSLTEFSEKLKVYKAALSCPSYEALSKLREFLRANKHYMNMLCNELKTIRFSEACENSTIHQIIYKLNNILQNVNDVKTTVEACNCLSEIGTYDLKTLVTVPPGDTKNIVAVQPKLYFANVVVTALSEVIFDEDPVVTSKVAKTLNRLLKFKEGMEALASVQMDKQLLEPFTSDQESEWASFKIDEIKLNLYAGMNFMLPENNETHNQWLIKHTSALLDIFSSDANYINALKEVCNLKPDVCRRILPPLMGLLLHCAIAEKHIKIISEQINRFFTYIWEISFDDIVDSSGDSRSAKIMNALDQDHKLIIQYMLHVVDFVRLQKKFYKSRSSRLENLNYLTLEYDKVAWAATVADQNLSAVYYGELWASSNNNGVPPSSPEETTAINAGKGKDLQRILRKSFVSIGELDAIDGCGIAHLTIEDEKRKHLINTGQYMDALLLHDIALSSAQSNLEMQSGAVRSLHKSGMHHLALQYIKSLPETDQLNDVKYECLTFLGDWSDFVDTRDLEIKSRDTNCNTQSILKAFRYACLKDCLNVRMKTKYEDRLEQPLIRAKLTISKLSQKLNMENCQSVYNVLSKLHLFNDIEDYFAVRSNKMPFYLLLEKWRLENLPAYQDFKHVEDLILQRNVILEHSAKYHENKLKDIVSLQLQYAELSLNNQRIQMSQRLLAAVKKLQTSEEVTLLESQISWAKGHRDIALSLLRNTVNDSKCVENQSEDLRRTAISLRQYGLWMAESKSDTGRDIINKYLKKSLEVLNRSDDVKTRLKVYYDIAKFADAEYKQVVTYMNSSIFENKVKCLENLKDTESTLKQTQQSLLTKDERKALFTNERFRQMDEAEIQSTRAEKESFLRLAMRYYLISLKECEENNLSVFRVISLWLSNPNFELDSSEGGSFEELLHGIPSRKFITVLPQLVPHLTDDNHPFAENLKKLIKRCAVEHPHHTLPILFSLKNSDKDKYILNASQAGGRGRRAPLEPRVVAADALVAALADEDPVLAVIIHQMEMLCDACISFANYKPKDRKQLKQKIPAAEKIHKLSRLDAIPLPSDTVPIKNDCNYRFMCTLVSFDNYFELVGGINCPKKINYTGSNGLKKILLIKGEDDLRQDAVMQQVFNIVNTLLEKNPITNRNKLLIRTYKVVPMSRQSGVLEWCEGTMPIGSYLVGTNGAHARYRPQDISSQLARQKLSKCHELRKSNNEKLAVFLSILNEFKPVFHYFFTEYFLDPVTWYERRLAYTKSVATSSMIGYILGLGDRHVQNILIDTNTAEVIHIDFGIAFDQGMTLHTPETVPFRLTQDMVAGFGCSGVEGIFRRSCEKTMQLLRDNQETLLTILEVLLCDPLYSWTVTGAQQTAPADTTAGTGSNSGLAERALLAVSSKLSGASGGAGGVAVPGQVARLVRTATDPACLCRLYPGWQPYL